TMASFEEDADGSKADWLPEIDGLRAGGLAACLVSAGFAFGFASPVFDLADAVACAGGGVVAVVSAGRPPGPILWARLEKKPSDCAPLAADATRVGAGVAVAGTEAGAAATTGCWSFASGACGGLTVPGIVPGRRELATSDRPCSSPPSDRPVEAPGTWEANSLFMPPSMPVLSFATGVSLET